MAKPRIYLSPSNQNGNVYATGGTNEMDQCDKIAKSAEKALKRCGFEVMVGKSGDSMQNRCKESDAFNADVHGPIHTNAFDAKTTGGTLVMLYKNTKKHNEAGKALLDAIAKISPGKDYSLRYRKDLYELSVPSAMSIYLEVEFHDTKTGSDWIRNNIDAIGEAYAKGMCDYFNVTYIAPSGTQSDISTKEIKELKVTMQEISEGNPNNRKGQVMTLQRILNELLDGKGYRGKDGEKLKVDGEFGENTAFALDSYRKNHNLPGSYVCGQTEWNALLCSVPPSALRKE